jgi:hypothetical protein
MFGTTGSTIDEECSASWRIDTFSPALIERNDHTPRFPPGASMVMRSFEPARNG